MAKVGRPTDYTQELAKEICITISTTSKGIKALCKENPHWPKRTTIFRWRIEIAEFRDFYDQAKKNQVETMVDECLDIADDAENDTIIKITKDGEEHETANTEWISRSRLRVDTRKWIAAKLAPRIYGERVDHKIDATVRQEDAIKELE